MSTPLPVVPPAQPYSTAMSVKKALATVGTVLAALAPAVLPSLVDYFSDEQHLGALLAVNPKLLALAPLIAGLIRFYGNRRKHADQ